MEIGLDQRFGRQLHGGLADMEQRLDDAIELPFADVIDGDVGMPPWAEVASSDWPEGAGHRDRTSATSSCRSPRGAWTR